MTTAEPETELSPERFDAVIFDLDGVVTRTALLHARAWKRIFDDYLARRSDKAGNRHYRPFDSDEDYRRYVDGKPRYEGVESFLASRNIELPYGAPTDGPDEETVCGLGNRKNALFRELLQHEGAEVYASSIALIRRLREAGFLTAVVSSSRNCAAVLHSVGAEDLFDARVDGVDAERQDLRGKPAPDIFLEAARRLGVAPGRAVVVEDAMAGVRAARAGEFGRVIGVDRSGKAEVLRSRGADLVVEDLSALSVKAPRAFGSEQSVPSALERLDEILQRAAGRRTVIFLDYDGTLTPIVERPEQARLAPRMRRTLERLADRYTVAIISGRDLHDVRQRVGLENPFYAGSHGFDIAGPRGSGQAPPEAEAALPELDAAETELREALRAVDGVLIERKRFG
ncbi:MAG: trehalose-phosphatase, partial [Gammaproteobacteria bacterium]